MQQQKDNCNRWQSPRQQIPLNITGSTPYQTTGSYLSSRPWNGCQQQHYSSYGHLSSSSLYPIPYSQNNQPPCTQRSSSLAWHPYRQQQLDNQSFFHSPSRRPLPPSFYHHKQNYHHHHGCCGCRTTISNNNNNAGTTGVVHLSASGSLDTFLKPRPPHSRDIVVIIIYSPRNERHLVPLLKNAILKFFNYFFLNILICFILL